MRLALVAVAMLSSACAARQRLRDLRSVLPACPGVLSPKGVEEPGTYSACSLPAGLLRNDWADDELELPDWSELEAFSGKVPLEKFRYQLERLVNPDRSLQPWISLEGGELRPDPVLAPEVVVRLPAGGAVPERCSPPRLQEPLDPQVPWRSERRLQLLAAAIAGRPLAGVRVAVDPGHFGGPFAAFEHRRFDWADASGRRWTIEEGELTLRTALELKAKLEAAGATVFLTREGPGPEVAATLASLLPFADGLLRHAFSAPEIQELDGSLDGAERARFRAMLALHALRKQFVFESLRGRMRRVAAFDPDLMISIHFNAGRMAVGEKADEFLVAMVKGNYQAVRLYNPYFRFRALRDALAVDELGASAHLGAMCLRRMSSALGIPVAGQDIYEDHQPLAGADGKESGVAAWNGAIFRYVWWPAVLTEGPFMNERDEIPRLGSALTQPPGTEGTRTDQYAGALAQGIEDWVARWLSSPGNPFGAAL